MIQDRYKIRNNRGERKNWIEIDDFTFLSAFDEECLGLLNFNSELILIPKKLEFNLKRYFPKAELKKIDKDVNVAIEKCLLFTSYLHSTYYTENKWKYLNWEILHETLKIPGNNTYIYRKIIEILKKGTSKDHVLDIKENDEGKEEYVIGIESKKYRITETYLKAGLTEYKLKTDYLIERQRQHFFKRLSSASENSIARNLINVYGKLSLPNKIEILNRGKELCKNDFITKKGNTLTMRNKHANSYWEDYKNRSFVEDNIKLYEYLTNRGFFIPIIGKEKSGSRVVDSFTLMPSWIRNQIKIDGEETVEIDYSCLHPNIAVSLYSGNSSYIKHKDIAKAIDMDLQEVKIEHLSFFNKAVGHMEKSKLFKYYMKYEKWMMDLIIKDKYENDYKITSKKLFKKETEIMTEVIEILNKEDIYVLYVYDALVSTKSKAERVKEVMNEVILRHKVYTKAV